MDGWGGSGVVSNDCVADEKEKINNDASIVETASAMSRIQLDSVSELGRESSAVVSGRASIRLRESEQAPSAKTPAEVIGAYFRKKQAY